MKTSINVNVAAGVGMSGEKLHRMPVTVRFDATYITVYAVERPAIGRSAAFDMSAGFQRVRLTRTRLLRAATVFAPGISARADVASHHGTPVLRIRTRDSHVMRVSLEAVLLALRSIGYQWSVETTAGTDRALNVDQHIARIAQEGK